MATSIAGGIPIMVGKLGMYLKDTQSTCSVCLCGSLDQIKEIISFSNIYIFAISDRKPLLNVSLLSIHSSGSDKTVSCKRARLHYHE